LWAERYCEKRRCGSAGREGRNRLEGVSGVGQYADGRLIGLNVRESQEAGNHGTVKRGKRGGGGKG